MKPNNEFQYDVFVSYSHKDKKWVHEWLLSRLESFGVSVCIDFRDFEPGAPSLTEMERAVQTSHKTILVISSSYLESEWTEFETIMAQSLDPASRDRRLIPLLLETVNLPLRLSTLTYLNFSNPEIIDAQFQRLVNSIRKRQGGFSFSRILLIEDKDSWINIAKEVFKDYLVEEVRTATEGIYKLKTGGNFDLVLVNLNLTDFNDASGLEILEYIRDFHPSLPRIVISGKPFHGPIYSTLFQGYQITEYITKEEYNVSGLRHLVREILEPLRKGSPDQQKRKGELVYQLRHYYDQAMGQLNESLRALEIYEIRLRRELGKNQADDLTRPDKETMLQKKIDYKQKFETLYSQILISSGIEELNGIEKEIPNGW